MAWTEPDTSFWRRLLTRLMGLLPLLGCDLRRITFGPGRVAFVRDGGASQQQGAGQERAGQAGSAGLPDPDREAEQRLREEQGAVPEVW